ncbi:hypothetical protein F2P81_015280 [Scophthalmus maximus]|uniref:Uncharacterized protein n=1 Tax=Scophthalmus maximus TaxID=52904 RepID=A0A6A4SM72_SCOMX|nr:hypothetical protein F2P81_015280 [Scophthalmus maximus]
MPPGGIISISSPIANWPLNPAPASPRGDNGDRQQPQNATRSTRSRSGAFYIQATVALTRNTLRDGLSMLHAAAGCGSTRSERELWKIMVTTAERPLLHRRDVEVNWVDIEDFRY